MNNKPGGWLFLDESGTFAGRGTLDVVGGFWSPAGVTQDVARSFLRECQAPIPFHGNEICDEELFGRVLAEGVRAAGRRGWRPALFQAEQYVQIVDNPRTYLNVLVEGVIKWMRLSGTWLEGRPLSIVAARRSLPVTEGGRDYVAIPETDYSSRLQERLELEWFRHYGLREKPKAAIEIVPANDDFRLQIADLFVHGWRRQNLPLYVRRAYREWASAGFVRVFEGDLASQIQQRIADGHWSSALDSLVAAIYRGDVKPNAPLVGTLEDNLTAMDNHTLSAILEQAVSLLQARLAVRRQLGETHPAAFWACTFLPRLAARRERDLLHWYAVRFQLLRLVEANHRGDLRLAETVLGEIGSELPQCTLDLDRFSDSVRLSVLRGVHATNNFDFSSAAADLVPLAERMQALFEITVEGGSGLSWKASLLGEIWGTLLQARMYEQLLRESPDWEAVFQLSDRARGLFVFPEDLSRQWQYRAQVATYARDFREAARSLDHALGLEGASDEERFRACLAQGVPFPLQHLLRLWVAEGAGAASPERTKDRALLLERSRTTAEAHWPEVRQYPWPSLYQLGYSLHMLAGHDTVADGFLERAETGALAETDQLTVHTLALKVRLEAAGFWAERARQEGKPMQRERLQQKADAHAARFRSLLARQIAAAEGLKLGEHLVQLQDACANTPLHAWRRSLGNWLPF